MNIKIKSIGASSPHMNFSYVEPLLDCPGVVKAKSFPLLFGYRLFVETTFPYKLTIDRFDKI